MMFFEQRNGLRIGDDMDWFGLNSACVSNVLFLKGFCHGFREGVEERHVLFAQL